MQNDGTRREKVDGEQHGRERILVGRGGGAMAEEVRGVAVGIAEDGWVTVARGDLASMSTHERGLVAHAIADLLAEILGSGGVRVH